MAARALQSVTITFGLVTIPVKMYAATDPQAAFTSTICTSAGAG